MPRSILPPDDWRGAGLLVLILSLLLLMATPPANAQESPREARLFAAETAGGTVGATTGLLLGGYTGYLVMKALPCDRVRCGFALLGGLIAGSTALATAGTYIAAQQVGGEHSVAGAALGATLGLLGGYKAAAVLEDRGLPISVVVLAFPATQGAMAAFGSRIAIRIQR